MKVLNIVVLLIATGTATSRILHAAPPKTKSPNKRHAKPNRKLFNETQLTGLSNQLNNDLDLIIQAYDHIEGSPLGKLKDPHSVQNAKSPSSPEFIRGVKEIELSLKDANGVLMRYINHYILTEKVVKKYDNYLKVHKGKKDHSQNDILVYLAKHVKDIKMCKKEDLFFSAVNRYNDLIGHQLEKLKNSPNKSQILRKIKVKLANGNRLVTFVKKYMFFVTHLNTDYHFVDHEFAKYGASRDPTHEKHFMSSKGFTKNNDHIALTIVISREDLQHIQESSLTSSVGNGGSVHSTDTQTTKTTHIDEKQSYIDKQLQHSDGSLGDIMGYAGLHDDNNNSGDDDQELKLLAREKEEVGLNTDPDQKISFIEPRAKPIASFVASDLDTLDIEHSNRVNEILNIKKDKSELDYLNNIPGFPGASKLNIDITNDVYKPSIGDQQNGGILVKREDAYLHNLLGLNHESEELHLSSQSNPNEPSRLELIRQPTIEAVHDHGYITVINPDDDRNSRLSKKAEFDNTPIGKESHDVVQTYNQMANYNSQDLNGFLQSQDDKVKRYFQPIINQTFSSMNQPILQQDDKKINMPYYINENRSTYGLDPQIGRSLMLSHPVQLVSQGNTMTSNAQARHLFSPAGGYWNRKAEAAFKNLFSGKFRL